MRVMSLHVSHNFNSGMILFAFPVAIQDDWKQASINDKVASNRILMFAHRSLRRGANIATCTAKGCSVQKTILERDYCLFAALLSELDLGNADTREA